jgi:hypothetical protein
LVDLHDDLSLDFAKTIQYIHWLSTAATQP